MFEFLDDTLNDWPESETSRTVSQTKNSIETIAEEENIAEDDVEDDSVVLLEESVDVDNHESTVGQLVSRLTAWISFVDPFLLIICWIKTLVIMNHQSLKVEQIMRI